LLTLITVLLGMSALYSGGMWLWLAALMVVRRSQYDMTTLIELERQTFHLGLCFILATGFLLLGAR
jgi:hypothetical protein